MIKHCVICGACFSAPPSSKKITCSAECSAKRKAQSHKGIHYAWSDSAREKKRLQPPQPQLAKGAAVNASMPGGMRGEDHRSAKVWRLIAPDGERIEVVNLQHWARNNAHLFGKRAGNDHDAAVIAHGFKNISESQRGLRKRPVSTYKGWSLAEPPSKKSGGNA